MFDEQSEEEKNTTPAHITQAENALRHMHIYIHAIDNAIDIGLPSEVCLDLANSVQLEIKAKIALRDYIAKLKAQEPSSCAGLPADGE